MSTEFSPSELIYLFLDGEHNGVERSMLFKAMAENQELQHEFEDALNIRNAAAREAADIAPSAALGHSLMARAGFAPTAVPQLASAGGAVVAATSPWFSGLFSHWSNIALLCLLPLLGVGGGYYASMSSNLSQSQHVYAGASVTPESSPNVATGSDREQLLQQILNQRSSIAELQEHISRTEHNISYLGALAQQLSKERADAQLAHGSMSESTSRNASNNTGASLGSSLQTSASDNNGTIYPVLNSERQGTNESLSPVIPQASIGSSARLGDTRFKTVIVDRYSVPDINLKVESASAAALQTERSRWNMELRNIQSLAQTRNADVDPASAHNIANFSASLVYAYSEHFSFLLGGGHENFVSLDYTNAGGGFGTPEVRQYMTWAIAGARYTADQWSEFLPIRHVLQLSGGVSDIGILAKVMPGIEWQPDSRVSFVAGVEQSLVVPTGKNQPTGNKTSLSYGVRINF